MANDYKWRWVAGLLFIIANPIFGIELWSFVQTKWCKGAELGAPKSFPS